MSPKSDQSYCCDLSCKNQSLPSYGDVSGPGVIGGFLGTAWLVIVLVVLHYLVVYDPAESPFRTNSNDHPRTPNGIDKLFKGLIKHIGKWVPFVPDSKTFQTPRWQGTFDKLILAMCDIQAVTGLGILISAFIDLHRGISSYHFLIIVRIAWFSNLTHIAGLVVLRRYLFLRPVEKWVRLFFMFSLTTMLLVAMGPTVFFNWVTPFEEESCLDSSASCPSSNAICFYNVNLGTKWHEAANGIEFPLSETSAFQSTVVSALLTVLGLASRIAKLFGPLSNAAGKFQRNCSRLWKRLVLCLSKGGQRAGVLSIGLRQFIFDIQLANLCLVSTYSELVSSTYFEVYWLVVAGTWGTLLLFMIKSSVNIEEDEWTFGQVLPIFLLLGPVIMAAQHFLWPEMHLTTNSISAQSASNEVEGAPSTRSSFMLLIQHDELEADNVGCLEIRKFRQQLMSSLDRDCYQPTDCKWMIPTVILLNLQIISVTVVLLCVLTISSASSIDVLRIFLFVFLVQHPSACFTFIFCSIIYENHAPLGAPQLGYWILMLALFVFSFYPLLYPFFDTYHLGSVHGVIEEGGLVFAGFIEIFALASACLSAFGVGCNIFVWIYFWAMGALYG